MEQTPFQTYINRAGLKLNPHQEDGVNWTLERETGTFALENVRGGFIADEMGLGKTILMIGTILANFKTRTLIVVPLALLNQWESEILRTTGVKPMVYHGIKKDYIPMMMLKSSPVVITTYGEIQLSKKEDCRRMESFIHDVEWDRVIFDEAHHLRNIKSQKFIGGKKLRATIRWMISGTPIQNRMTDLYALCEVLGFSSGFYSKKVNLRKIMDDYLLKRTKKEVGILLPDITEESIVVPWNSESEKMLAEDLHSKMECNGGMYGKLGVGDAIEEKYGLGWKLPLLLRAKQMCIYPKLMQKTLQDFEDEGFLEDDDYMIRRGSYGKSKMNCVCEKILERKNSGGRKIVFCHFRTEIDMIKERLEKSQMIVAVLDGRTKSSDRKSILSGMCDVLILQIMTGCEGLNLQEYNEIYFVTPHWNPAVEDQAVARCHRIGQKKQVYVFRFRMEGFDDDGETSTLDMYCTSVQSNKRKLFSLID
jgi:SNF2 family DNA or RNA helicase